MQIIEEVSANYLDQELERESDVQLVTAAKQGEQRAYAELCRRHTDRTLRTAYRITKNHEDAQDVVQESLMKAYIHLASFDGRSAFSTWLTGIAMNTALMLLRKRRRNPEHSLEINAGSDDGQVHYIIEKSLNPEDAILLDESLRMLRCAVNRLPPRLREVMYARHASDASVQELAATLGISHAAIKTRLVRGRAAIRMKLERFQLK